jgi:2-polyprenyl-3-methyl-5-hydroxy-6-metoxy-1,4-benzoquinol methylase|tara:strand:- start:564 stop:1421 length:858 start_codon:yes stop_codon:yes gene_type:complete
MEDLNLGGTMKPGKNNEEVVHYWDSNPIHSIEFGPIEDITEYCRLVDDVRWDEHERWAEKGFLDFGGDPGAKLLDAGCGIGVFTRYYSKKGYEVSAIDITPKAVEIAQSSLEALGLKGDVRQGSVEKIPFEDNQFDYVCCNGVIHHTGDTEKAAAEILRVLKPGGRAMISVYYRNFLLTKRFFPLMKTTLSILIRKSKLEGREKFLRAETPEDFVRIYDGDDTPIANLYNRAEGDHLFADYKILAAEPHYFPIRFFKFFKVGGLVHWALDRYCGTLIYYLLEKPA